MRFFLQDGVDYDEQGFIDVSDLFLCYQQDFIDGVDHDDPLDISIFGVSISLSYACL